MYFSRIRIKPDFFESPALSTMVVNQLKSVYGAHKLLWDLFPDQKQRSYLFRGEMDTDQGRLRSLPLYYVVSPKPPIENTLFDAQVKQYCPLVSQGSFFHFKLRANPVVAKKKEGKKNSVHHDVVMNCKHDIYQKLSKILGIEPTNSSSMKKIIIKKGTKTIGNAIQQLDTNFICEEGRSPLFSYINLQTDKCLHEWLDRKGKKEGGFQLSGELQTTGYQSHRISEKGKNAGFCSVDFEGKIMVTDPKKFKDTLFLGIGRAKSFGCGLMMIKP